LGGGSREQSDKRQEAGGKEQHACLQ